MSFVNSIPPIGRRVLSYKISFANLWRPYKSGALGSNTGTVCENREFLSGTLLATSAI